MQTQTNIEKVIAEKILPFFEALIAKNEAIESYPAPAERRRKVIPHVRRCKYYPSKMKTLRTHRTGR